MTDDDDVRGLIKAIERAEEQGPYCFCGHIQAYHFKEDGGPDYCDSCAYDMSHEFDPWHGYQEAK